MMAITTNNSIRVNARRWFARMAASFTKSGYNHLPGEVPNVHLALRHGEIELVRPIVPDFHLKLGFKIIVRGDQILGRPAGRWSGQFIAAQFVVLVWCADRDLVLTRDKPFVFRDLEFAVGDHGPRPSVRTTVRGPCRGPEFEHSRLHGLSLESDRAGNRLKTNGVIATPAGRKQDRQS